MSVKAWKVFRDGDQKYFTMIKLSDECYQFRCFVGGANDCYEAQLPAKELFELCKTFNPRINFDAMTVQNALVEFDPVQSELLLVPGGVVGSAAEFKLKYDVEGVPLFWKWQLRKCHPQKFWAATCQGSLLGLEVIKMQVAELRECLKRKDAEIAQYKFEGANLRRSTLSTKPFIEEDFERKYSTLNNVVDGLVSLRLNGIDAACDATSGQAEEDP